ncbi:MAG: hypothetical protein K2W92_02675 [Alphaproteobacteria bacterium]|nr:hypothetical protein [Alphaproteobacteria bacterium]
MSKYKLHETLNRKKVVLFVSIEGGVLKSTSADKFVSQARASGYKVAFYDADPENKYSNYKKYQTKDSKGNIVDDNEFIGCKKLNLAKEATLIINASDIPADYVVFDLGANKFEEAVSGLKDIQDFFLSFSDELSTADLVLSIPVSNDKCLRTFTVAYSWVKGVDADEVVHPIRVVSIINEGFMKNDEALLDKTMGLYGQDKFINLMNKDKRFDFKEVVLKGSFDDQNHMKNMLEVTNFGDAISSMEDRATNIRRLLNKHKADAANLVELYVDNQISAE